ncbi:hypothetical protein CFAM422_007315 [Trichoderma lentiforme]|uniref:Uncharacterized protein n=1 Tax=Trichoderma lentiforme TaxID=1567552 RepID=A0A9P4XEJ5_9HYPO|nr:hypothetical protein CFAM422_007315 [Trichoderma lentiforme]
MHFVDTTLVHPQALQRITASSGVHQKDTSVRNYGCNQTTSQSQQAEAPPPALQVTRLAGGSPMKRRI